MRRAPRWSIAFGVAVLWASSPGEVRADGFWVTLAAGVAGGANSSDYTEFAFDSPHAPPISVSQLTGTGNVQATTGGGNTFFTGAGTPVILPTTDGFATLSATGTSFPSAALPKFANATPASGAPQGGGSIPTNADQLSLGLGNPATNGSQVLSVGITDPNGNTLGQGHVTVPGGGWWVVGLGPGVSDTPAPIPVPVPTPIVPTPVGGQNGLVATPEPASAVLLGLGGIIAASWRLRRSGGGRLA